MAKKNNNGTLTGGPKSSFFLLVSQRFDGVEEGGLVRGIKSEEYSVDSNAVNHS